MSRNFQLMALCVLLLCPWSSAKEASSNAEVCTAGEEICVGHGKSMMQISSSYKAPSQQTGIPEIIHGIIHGLDGDVKLEANVKAHCHSDVNASAVPLTAAGFDTVQAACCAPEMVDFIKRYILSNNSEVCNIGALNGFASQYDCPGDSGFTLLDTELIKAQSGDCAWIRNSGTPTCPVMQSSCAHYPQAPSPSTPSGPSPPSTPSTPATGSQPAGPPAPAATTSAPCNAKSLTAASTTTAMSITTATTTSTTITTTTTAISTVYDNKGVGYCSKDGTSGGRLTICEKHYSVDPADCKSACDSLNGGCMAYFADGFDRHCGIYGWAQTQYSTACVAYHASSNPKDVVAGDGYTNNGKFGHCYKKKFQCTPNMPGAGCVECKAEADRREHNDCKTCNPGYVPGVGPCIGWICSTDTGSGCKTCKPQADRTGQNFCETCNTGYILEPALEVYKYSLTSTCRSTAAPAGYTNIGVGYCARADGGRIGVCQKQVATRDDCTVACNSYGNGCVAYYYTDFQNWCMISGPSRSQWSNDCHYGGVDVVRTDNYVDLPRPIEYCYKRA